MTDVSCFSCAYSAPLTLPDGKIDFSMRVCVFMPPSPVVLPAGPGQMMIKALFPVVDRTMVCRQHAPKGDENALGEGRLDS